LSLALRFSRILKARPFNPWLAFCVSPIGVNGYRLPKRQGKPNLQIERKCPPNRRFCDSAGGREAAHSPPIHRDI
jgi:hypothetical protein